MNSVLDRVAAQLQSALGAAAVRREPSDSGAHGDTGAPVCSPATPEEVAAILRVCAEANAAVSPCGGATGVNVGNAPRQACVGLDLTRLHRIIEHDHANLTVSAQSGISLAALRDKLSAQEQFLPLDAPSPAVATLGGTVALNINGPRRAYYGGVRDLIIGMKVALMTGEHIKAGGKVVKNVAGYDMCKLFTGSLGTLGVITEVTARVAPIPETAATILASGMFEKVMAFVDQLTQSQLLPAAVVLMNSNERDGWQAAVGCEGQAEHVTRHLLDGAVMARQLGLATAVRRDHAHSELWTGVCNFPLQLERCVYRVTLPRARVASFVATLKTNIEPAARVISDMLTGTLWLSWPAEPDSTKLFAQLVALASAERGHAVLFAAPAHLKQAIDVWGPPPATYSLMRKIKQQFDPHGLLNPGRFIGGI